jgi:hypothetical protein
MCGSGARAAAAALRPHLQVALVAHEQLVDVLARVAVDLVQPLLDVGEGVPVGDVVDDDDAVGAAVVGRGDGAEALLPRRVPDLQLDGLGLQLDGADFLLHAAPNGFAAAAGAAATRRAGAQAREIV